MQQYIAGIVIFGFGPLLYAALYYFSDTWQYLREGDTDEILMWQVNRQYSHWHVHFVNLFMNCVLFCTDELLPKS